MRVLDVRHRSVPVSRYSPEVAAPASLDTTIVAVVTDRKRGAEPIVGYGFASIGRFAQEGLIRERFAPRLLQAEPTALIHSDGEAIDPSRAWSAMMAGEKPGGHGERCVAVGALDMAIWDAAAKARGLPLYRLLAREFGTSVPLNSVPCYAGGGYYFPDDDFERLRAEAQYFLSLGLTSAKIKIGGMAIMQDCRSIETVLDVLGSGNLLAATR